MANSEDPRMKSLRKQMDEFKPPIGKDAKENGIWLPRTSNDRLPGSSTTAHKGDGIHSEAYKQEMFERLDGKSRANFIAELEKINAMENLFDINKTMKLFSEDLSYMLKKYEDVGNQPVLKEKWALILINQVILFIYQKMQVDILVEAHIMVGINGIKHIMLI